MTTSFTEFSLNFDDFLQCYFFLGGQGNTTGFGEIAILHSCPRTATVAVPDGTSFKVWSLERDAYQYIIRSEEINKRQEITQVSDIIRFNLRKIITLR